MDLGEISRIILNKKINRIFIQSHFNKFDLTYLIDAFTSLFQGFFNRFTKYFSAIFRRTNNMIQKQIFVVLLCNINLIYITKVTFNFLTLDVSFGESFIVKKNGWIKFIKCLDWNIIFLQVCFLSDKMLLNFDSLQ